MTNIFDYLLWRGDIPLSKEFPLNEVDTLILARLSYLPFDKINFNKESINVLSKKMNTLDEELFARKEDNKLINMLGNSARFKDLIISDYIKNDDKTLERQFSAITIHLSKKELFISYVGTDNSFIGWKEDFNMAFMDNVSCQLSGLSYLEEISKKYPNKKIFLGGHSKGGNIAIYSSVAVTKKIQDRIIKVNNFDGPGFNTNVINKYVNSSMINKIETFVPGDSIIGRLLDSVGKVTICQSSEKGIKEHDLYSWTVKGKELIKLDKNTKISEDINSTVTNWLKETTKEQRKIFIDTIFEVLYSSEVDSFNEIVKSLTITTPKILKKYNELSDEEKKIMTEMLKKFIMSYFNTIMKKKDK